ncbi:MAG: AglZ/HisF2 family acetamidino modification protein [Bacteroidia bacterium]
MVGTRIIPCLLYKGSGLVKTVKFKDPVYIGDVTNAIRIFNEKEVDELILLDIEASVKKQKPNVGLVKKIASECFMPLCYGGGITSVQDIRDVVSVGVEKVSLNSIAVQNPAFVKEAASTFGSSTILVTIDYKKNMWGKLVVTGNSGHLKSKYNPLEFAQLMEDLGAGEIVVNSIDRDGTMTGYDVELLKRITEKVTIPVIAMGGAGKLDHFFEAINNANVSAVAAGSFFVFQGRHKAVLINYPDRSLFEKKNTI